MSLATHKRVLLALTRPDMYTCVAVLLGATYPGLGVSGNIIVRQWMQTGFWTSAPVQDADATSVFQYFSGAVVMIGALSFDAPCLAMASMVW